MRHFFTILGHELRMLLVNGGTYLAAVLFLMLMGFIFSGVLEDYSKAARETSPAVIFFQLFWLPVFFIVPLLTMRCIAEERRHGTLETLLTTPVTTAEVVLGKFSAAYLLYLALWAGTGGFFYLLKLFAGEGHFLDLAPLVGGYTFIALSGLLFIALGVFASALSRNQAVAGILAFSLLFLVVIGFRFIGTLDLLKLDSMQTAKAVLDHANLFRHLEDFSRGIVDTRHILFYLSGTAFTLLCGILAVEVRQVHS